MKKFFFLLLALHLSLFSFAQEWTKARQEIHDNMLLCGSNYVAYPDPTEDLTPAPKGYEPFYLTHYGRHGSRWLCNDHQYKKVLTILEDAQSKGILTDQGQYLLAQMNALYVHTKNRIGELSGVGEHQHHRIGKRLAEHFPEIFSAKDCKVDARSTVVIRCILSMEAECEELAAFNPNIKFHNDVSESFQYYLNQDWSDRIKADQKQRWSEVTYDYSSNNLSCGRFWGLLFTDPNYRYGTDPHRSTLQKLLFNIACNMQSHFGNRKFPLDSDDTRSNGIPFNPFFAGESQTHPSLKGIPGTMLYDYFTEDEAYGLWRIQNTEWYVNYSSGSAPFTQENLLKNFLLTADTILKHKDYHGATLRFGHEVCVMPLAALLELGNCYPKIPMSDIEHLDATWANFRIFPMGSNIQLIFYRPKKGKEGDILVKALLNEREVTLPGTPVTGPYYKWSDLEQYYKKKLADYDGGVNFN